MNDYDADLLEVSAALALIRRAGQKARVVVVYLHVGAEGSDADHVTGQEEYYLGGDRGNPGAFAHLAIDAGASLVITCPAAARSLSSPGVRRGLRRGRGPHPALRRHQGAVTIREAGPGGRPGRPAAFTPVPSDDGRCRLKPEIPLVGHHGIALHDELQLHKRPAGQGLSLPGQ